MTEALKILGIIVAVVAGIKAVYEIHKWLKPITEISTKFSQLDSLMKNFETLERHTAENYETNQILCEGMLYLLRNARSGNSIEDLKRVEDKFVVHLAKK